jgi:hypothetical protein
MAKSPKGGDSPATRNAGDDGIAKLVENARKDPAFFHRLVFHTEDAIASLPYLSRAQKAAIMAVDPDRLVAGLAGSGGSPGSDCGVSCGSSCGTTCGGTCGGSCGNSCGSSCSVTCGTSCGDSCSNSCSASCDYSCVVSGGVARQEEWVSLPPERLAEEIRQRVRDQIAPRQFSRFRR